MSILVPFPKITIDNKFEFFTLQLSTEYKELEEPAMYNLNLKGKNFRSAILFMLGRAMYNNLFEDVKKPFEETKFYV